MELAVRRLNLNAAMRPIRPNEVDPYQMHQVFDYAAT